MNQGFHYYATYVAAIWAGYSQEEAQTIAYAAQYVDDFNASRLSSFGTVDSVDDAAIIFADADHMKYGLDQRSCAFAKIVEKIPYSERAKPIPTVQTNAELAKANLSWTQENLTHIIRIWASFHFLPGNFGTTPDIRKYEGKSSCVNWSFDKDSELQFKLLCRPRSDLSTSMINDILDSSSTDDYRLILTGLRLHVLQDTWAHQDFAGVPFWFLNDVADKVSDQDNKPIVWKNSVYNIFNGIGEESTPSAVSHNSMAYLGHGRMGHLPDIPYMHYTYTPQFSSGEMHVSNPSRFLSAFLQTYLALSAVRNNTTFTNKLESDLTSEQITQINSILSNRTYGDCKCFEKAECKYWEEGIRTGLNIPVPGRYNPMEWMEEFRFRNSCAHTAQNIMNSYHYRFARAACHHSQFVYYSLKSNGMDLNTIVPSLLNSIIRFIKK